MGKMEQICHLPLGLDRGAVKLFSKKRRVREQRKLVPKNKQPHHWKERGGQKRSPASEAKKNAGGTASTPGKEKQGRFSLSGGKEVVNDRKSKNPKRKREYQANDLDLGDLALLVRREKAQIRTNSKKKGEMKEVSLNLVCKENYSP